jgi:hypothetical protein
MKQKGVCQIPKLLLQRIMVAVYSKYNITISIPLRSAETNAAEALVRRNSTV